jgi:hypothetical protein
MQFGVKIGSLFFVTILVILFYALIYYQLCNQSFSQAIYTSALIQTLNGKNDDDDTTTRQKMIITSQSIIAYMITSGLIIFSIHVM